MGNDSVRRAAEKQTFEKWWEAEKPRPAIYDPDDKESVLGHNLAKAAEEFAWYVWQAAYQAGREVGDKSDAVPRRRVRKPMA